MKFLLFGFWWYCLKLNSIFNIEFVAKGNEGLDCMVLRGVPTFLSLPFTVHSWVKLNIINLFIYWLLLPPPTMTTVKHRSSLSRRLCPASSETTKIIYITLQMHPYFIQPANRSWYPKIFSKSISIKYLAVTFPFSSLFLLCSSTTFSSSSSFSRSWMSSSLSSSFCWASASCRILSNFLSSSRRICSFCALILRWWDRWGTESLKSNSYTNKRK